MPAALRPGRSEDMTVGPSMERVLGRGSGMIRKAACNCGQLVITCDGEPARISVCHCLECQRRTGSVFSSQAWFKRRQITDISGESSAFSRVSDAGRSLTYHFCPVCGSTIYWEAELFPGLVAVAVGSFADPSFPAPSHSVWESRQHPWVGVSSATSHHVL